MDAFLDKFCGKDKWAAYCISLERCTERRANFEAWAKHVELTFTFFNAIDKRDLTEAVCLVGDEPSLGATACRLSHMALYEVAASTNKEWILIFEDDAGFKNSSKADLYKFLDVLSSSKLRPQMVQFGYHTAEKLMMNLIWKTIDPMIYKYEAADQAHAILYRKKTITDLMGLCSIEVHKKKPIDAVIIVWQRKNSCIGPETSVIEQVDPISYIWSS
jgi:GR25 family glycosyltransferase involved in LPS biosynthesis